MNEQWDKITELQEQNAHMLKNYFFEHVLFTPQWWFLTIISIVLWSLWLFLSDKSRLKSLLLVGLLISIQSIIYDDVGISMAAWNYPYPLFFVTSRLDVVDISILPVAYMLVYQYFPKWKSYLITTMAFCLFASFIAEPIFVHFNLYDMFHWKYWYSAPIYMAMGILVKAFVDWLDKRNSG